MAGPDLVKTFLYTLNNLLQQEKYKAVLAVVKGFRNGAVWVKTLNKWVRHLVYHLATAVLPLLTVVFPVVVNQYHNTLYTMTKSKTVGSMRWKAPWIRSEKGIFFAPVPSGMELKSGLPMRLWWHFFFGVAGNSSRFDFLLERFAIAAALPSPCFYSHSLKDKLGAILKATYTHSRNLACFVFTYKGLRALQHSLHGKSLQAHSFLAACVGGWLIFGDNNHINSQVQSFWNPLPH